MRKVVFILVLSLFTGVISSVNAQDIITLRSDGSEIRAKVTEIGMNDVKYKLYGQDSPVYTLKKAEIFSIQYENGTKELFQAPAQPPQQPQQPQPQQQSQPPFTSTPSTGQGGVIASSYRPASDTKRGFIGAGVGAAFLLEEYSNVSIGYQLNVNAGYLLSTSVGITASYASTSFKVEDTEVSFGMRGAFIGPLFSFASSSGKLEYDIRPTAGFVKARLNLGSVAVTFDNVFGFDLGFSLRYHLSSVISLVGNVDYLYHSKFEEASDMKISSGALGIGLNFRF